MPLPELGLSLVSSRPSYTENQCGRAPRDPERASQVIIFGDRSVLTTGADGTAGPCDPQSVCGTYVCRAAIGSVAVGGCRRPA